MNEEEIRSCPSNLWFEGYIGLGGRIAPTKLPEKFSVDLWESLDCMLNDEPTLDVDSDMEGSFYIFKLEAESGYEAPHEHEIGLSISDFVEINSSTHTINK
jgi:hypothetical protein